MVIKTPLPPGSMMTLYNDDERFVEKYLTKYPGKCKVFFLCFSITLRGG
jgi:acyl-coenzyme A synthetase/AMP-(fatty) acid ligase